MSITRSRGYAFEIYVVEQFKKSGYYAYRLGGTTKTMPDVHAIINDFIYGIECKSTQGTQAKFPAEQILRCHSWAIHLSLYQPRVILACKFKGNEKRKLKYSYYNIILSNINNPTGYLGISYNGKVKNRVNSMDIMLEKVELIP